MTKITVRPDWVFPVHQMIKDLEILRDSSEIYSSLQVDTVRECNDELRVIFYFNRDEDILYERILNIIREAEKNMQAISFTKTSNIQGNTGGICSAF